MSAIVIDVSAAVPWVLPQERTDFSDNLYAQICTCAGIYHAPALWLWEAGNLIMSAVRRNYLSPEAAQAGLEQLRRCEITFAPVPSAHKQSQIMRLALTHQLSYHEASYLELVLSLNGQLASSDAPLVAAAKACGVFCIDI